MKIIKKGSIPEDTKHVCTCSHCKTVFECSESECTEESCGLGSYSYGLVNLIINCPLCIRTVVVTQKTSKRKKPYIVLL